MQVIFQVKVPSFMWLIEGTELLKLALAMAFHCTRVQPGSGRQVTARGANQQNQPGS